MEESKLIDQLRKQIALRDQEIDLYKQEETLLAKRYGMAIFVELVIESVAAQMMQTGSIRTVSVDACIDSVLRDIQNTHNMALENAATKIGILPDEMLKSDAE